MPRWRRWWTAGTTPRSSRSSGRAAHSAPPPAAGSPPRPSSNTARYDGAIADYLGRIAGGGERSAFPPTWSRRYRLSQEMRYGENPHQRAAFYVEPESGEASVASARQLQGKALSYNNVADTTPRSNACAPSPHPPAS